MVVNSILGFVAVAPDHKGTDPASGASNVACDGKFSAPVSNAR